MAAGVCGGSKTRKNASKDGASSSDSDDDPVVFHLTRSQVAAMATGRTAGGKHPPTSSVFDAPAFADINSLLLAIDRGRKIKTVEATVNICLTQSSSDQTVTMQPPLTQQQQWVNALNSLPEKVQCVLTQFHSRVWRCLIPR